MAKDERIHLRVDAEKKRLFEAASAASNSSVSAFILDAATIAAENRLADRHLFRLDDEQWRAFDGMLRQEPRDLRGLDALMQTPTVLDDRG